MAFKMKTLTKALAKNISLNPTAAIILAAGDSTRMGKNVNKQTQLIDGFPVLAHTLLAYQQCSLIQDIIVVTKPELFADVYSMAQTYHIKKLRHIVAGGSTRQESAKKGFAKLNAKIKYVAIADGARCLTTPEQIAKIALRAYRYEAASAGHAVNDTVKRTTATGSVKETVDRKNLWLVQTPQIFHTTLYAAALQKAEADHFEGTDDNALLEHLGYRIQLVECGVENLKITSPDDLIPAEAILQHRRLLKTTKSFS